jgi:hypothetical protein
MVLTFAEDFTSSVNLDSDLVGTSESGLFWNRGVLPLVTVKNLLDFLPILDFTFSSWNISTPYVKFEDSKSKGDIVTYEGETYQAILSGTEKQPDTETLYWLKTNEESLRIKSFIWSVRENLLSALSLSRKLIENQYLYNVGENLYTASEDYVGWCFEPKGSDYVKIRINQMALQANTTEEVVMSVVNQGRVVDTITLSPNNGLLSFEDTNYTISGKGRFFFLIEAQEVYSDNAHNDPLKFSGFTCYPVLGSGDSPEGATIKETTYGNGLNFNLSVYLDSTQYVDNNLVDLAKMYQSQFEMDFIQMMQLNANSRVHGDARDIDKNLLTYHASDLTGNTAARRYRHNLKLASEAINKTFDRFLKTKNKIRIRRSTI